MTDETRGEEVPHTFINSDESSMASGGDGEPENPSDNQSDTSDTSELENQKPAPPSTPILETREILTNPFQVGDQVMIPAGTTFTSTNPSVKGRQKTKRSQVVTVEETFPAFLVRTKTNRILVRPLRIRTKGSGGYAKDINITEMIVRLNGKTPHYEQVPVDV